MNKQEFDNAVVVGKSRSDCGPENIDTLVKIIRESVNIPGDIAEMGSYKGGATIAMAAAALYYLSFPVKRVYAFDLFGGLPYGEFQVGFEYLADTDFEEIKEAFKPYSNIVTVKGTHEVTVPNWESRPLSLIFMDSDFYSSHMVCLKYLWPMLSPGGSIVFHDWRLDEVKQAVKEFFDIRERRKCDYLDCFLSESQNMGLIRKRI
jgi:O-methyltransferase